MKHVLTILSLLLSAHLAWAEPVDVTSTEPHRVRTIEKGIAGLQQRLVLIENAQNSIDVEYFIYDKSDASRIFTEALLRKKSENPEVQIRIIVDYFALSKSLDPYITTALMNAGIEVRYYNPSFLLNFGKVTHRNHRKILLVDKKQAIVGGRNMADEYFDLKKKHNFMDRDVWVEGPIAEDIGDSFNHFWNSKHSKIPKKPRAPVRDPSSKNQGGYQVDKMRHERRLREGKWFASVFDPVKDKELIELRERIIEKGKTLIADEPIYDVGRVRFIADGADFKDMSHSITGKAYYEMMDKAKDRIMLETPYFYLQKEEKSAFEVLKERNVQIQLLLNSKKASNEFAINYISLLQGLEFSRMGFDLFLNKGQFMTADELVTEINLEKAVWMVHAKTMLIDDHVSWIGTLNMDPRSIQRLNAELALVVEDEAFNARVKGHLTRRYQASYPVVNGKVRKDDGEHDPSQLESLWEGIKSLMTQPFYWFENQI